MDIDKSVAPGASERDIVESVPSALLVLDNGLRVMSANGAFYRAFQTSPGATLGRSLFDLGNRQWDIPELRRLLESVVPLRTPIEAFEVDHKFPAVGQRTILVNARRIFSPGSGDEGTILVALADVTEERAATIESKRNWQLTQSIVDTIREPLVVLEDDMTVVTASRAFRTIFGIAEGDARGRSLAELGQHQWDVPALRHLMEQVLPEDKPIEAFEIEDTFPGLGRRIFSLNARKISQPGNHAHRMLLVFEDITDRKQRERDALSLTNEISHRIKNNLQVIVSLIAFEARSAGDACVGGYQAMQTRIGAIAQLYDLLAHSNRGRIVSIDEYLREIAATMSASLLGSASGIKIEVQAEALDIDPDRAVPFGLLANELVTNAIKHAFPNGNGRVTLGARRVADDIELTVADDGIGMTTRDSARTSERRGSDYVAMFVRQLGGAVVLAPAASTGTIITVRFPMLPLAGAGSLRAMP